MIDHIRASFEEARATVDRFLGDEENLRKVERMATLVADALEKGNRVYSCGNGGSTCDAMHFAEELTGRYRKDRRALAAQSLADPSHITCTANDFGFDHIFSRAVEAYGRKGDVLIALSTSGNSPNILKALHAAKALGIATVGLLGRDGGACKDLVDLAIIAPAQLSDRIQEIHIKVIHIAIEAIERRMFPENYR
jgi:D-sedoheptulose 7-phosphate isomerase